MATLTRVRPTFQVEEAEPEPRRPIHLDIPTPFPHLPQLAAQRSDHSSETNGLSSGTTPVNFEAEGGRRNGLDVEGPGVVAEATVSRVDENTDSVSRPSLSHSLYSVFVALS